MMELLITVFSATFFVTIIRTTTPLLLATMVVCRPAVYWVLLLPSLSARTTSPVSDANG